MTDCAAPRHDGQDDPSPAEAHATLCRPCRVGLSRDLRRLPALDHALGILSIVRASPGNGAIPLPFDEDISQWQSWFRRVVTRATITIALARKWRLPADHPWAMCAWLEPQVSWISFHGWAADLADMFHRGRVRGEQLATPLEIKRVFIPSACLDCGNGRMDAVIYVDHNQGRWSYWVCPVCRTATQIEFWWDYKKRLAAIRAQASLRSVTMMLCGLVFHGSRPGPHLPPVHRQHLPHGLRRRVAAHPVPPHPLPHGRRPGVLETAPPGRLAALRRETQ